jgi:hypothetical protein
MRLTHTPYLGAYEHVGIKKVETTYTIERERVEISIKLNKFKQISLQNK